MTFHDPKNRELKELLSGVHTRTFWGEYLMFSLVELDANAIIPSHSHPQEQGTYMLSGGFEATVDGETCWVSPGQLFIVPGGMEHRVRVEPGVTRVVDVFALARDDLKY